MLLGSLCLLGFSVHMMSAQEAAPRDSYPNHSRLMVYAAADGTLQPVRTPDDWAKRRADILKGVEAAMGPLPSFENLPAFQPEVKSEEPKQGYMLRSLTIRTEGEDRLPVDLYLPEGPGKKAAILALHPTGAEGRKIIGEGGKPNRTYAVELAKRGYVVIAPDYPSFGDLANYDFQADKYVSGSMKAIFNHMRCVDFLQSLPEVDGERIGVIGHSLGGHNAMFVALFDPRIKVIVSSCGWCPFHDYYGGKIAGWTSDRYMPRLRDVYGLDPNRVPFDFYEVVAALAPRPFLSCSPVSDSNFDVEGVKKAIPRAQEVYRLLGAEDQLKLTMPKCEHDFPTEVRLDAYSFLDKALAHTPAQEMDYSAELPRIAPLEPAEALKSIEVLPGFKVEQTAAEPLVTDPVAISFDENGRLFVIEMRDYSEQDKEFLGQVRVLTDTDSDGKFDKYEIFAENLSWPTAILCYDGGVFVGAPPHLMYLKDTDGDGKADVRKTLFTGFGRNNVQGMMNSLRWGLDNRVHGASGTNGGIITRPEVADFKPVDLRGRDFSFDPRLIDLRPESGGAQHGMSFDDWGRKYCGSNSDHCQFVMYDDRYVARNPALAARGARINIALDGPQAEVFRISPVEPWRIVRTRLRASGVVRGAVEGGGRPAGYFTGSTGITIYRGDAWPADNRGMAFIGDVGSNLIHRKKVEPDGVGFKADRIDPGTEFVRSSDIWFRPVQFANAPDGCLHILDMYREVIEHPISIPPEIKQHLDLTSGRDRGRLYRVVPDNFQPRPVPQLGKATTAELVATLEHPNAWHRETAGRLLYERQDAAAIPLLTALAQNSQSPLGRVHALYSLGSQKARTETLVSAALNDADPNVREHAIRFAEAFPESSALRDKLAQLAADPAPRVRYQLAFTAGEFPMEWRKGVLLAILKQDGTDPWVRQAALSSLPNGAAEVLNALLADPSWKSARATGPVVADLARLVARQNQPEQLASLVRQARAISDSNPALAQQIVIELGLGQRALKSSLAKADATKTLEELHAQARQLVAEESTPLSVRIISARSLGFSTFETDGDLLVSLLEQRQPVEVQKATLEALGRFASPAATTAILEAWSGMSPAVRSQAEEILFARPAAALALLTAIESGDIRTADLTPARLQLLQTHPDKGVQAQAVKVLANTGAGQRQAVLDQYQAALNLAGDYQKGQAAFRKTCATCHRLENHGFEIGPNLATIKNRGKEAILLNVIDPNREVNPQFLGYVVVTSDGLTHTGMIQSETATSITLVRAENQTETILRSDIEQLRSTGLSLMPEGLEKDIDLQTMADILDYLLNSP